MTNLNYKKIILFFVLELLFQPSVYSEEIHVGAVFNSLSTLSEIIELFERESLDKVILHKENHTTMTIYNQIKEQDNLDIVLLGDMKTALRLEKEGLTTPETHFTYAFGQLVLWSKNPTLVDAKGEVLTTGHFKKIAIVDPRIASYGMAARQVLEKLQRWETLRPKLVFVSNAGEMQRKVLNGEVDLGFIPLVMLNPYSQDGIEGSLWLIPKNYYTPLEQQAILLNRAKNNEAAKNFFDYLKSPQARNIFEKYGFSVP
ncbi:MAG: molybdate ABC transporter substrate-binding protein [Thiotrichaceae bacterium]|nr:molybdate ABC transporter substrate-binding protein [Thiotrichaceae bacterium]